MNSDSGLRDDLLHRLPLPLAQLYRRALNAKTPLERHQAAYFVWEAAIKLLSALAICEYAEQFSDPEQQDPKLTARLKNLARPSVGHWWEFVRLLSPVLAEHGDAGFAEVDRILLSRNTRDDLPRTAGLDSALASAMEVSSGSRTTVRVRDLFDRFVQYRNRELGHGALGQKSNDYYERMSETLLAAAGELFSRCDVMAGRRLLVVTDVRRRRTGDWELDQYELTGETPRRTPSLVIPEKDINRLPKPERLYAACPTENAGDRLDGLVSLHPLVVYDAEAGDVLFLNSRRGRSRAEYLSYVSGQVLNQEELVGMHHELLSRLLDVPVDEAEAGQWAGQAEEEEAAEAGPGRNEDDAFRRIGEFELLGKVGVGGMGDVYRAWQPSLGRQVALKCMRRKGDAGAEARFAREIRALGRVEHPHLVKIFTSGSEADRWFYAMEMVDGAPLSQLLKTLLGDDTPADRIDVVAWQRAMERAHKESQDREHTLSEAEGLSSSGGSLPDGTSTEPGQSPPGRFVRYRTDQAHARSSYVERVVDIVRQIAEAAHALHEADIVHRDIKPENIMITPDGEHAVLMDLGLAKILDDDQSQSRTREFLGTVRYASPEQVLSAKHVDRRTDVYSLGVILWELLALRPIYGITPDTPTPELMQRIQSSDPDRIRKYQRRVPVALEAIVLKCLEKNRERRYQSALELADDLIRWQRGEDVRARRPSVLLRTSKALKRRWKPLAIVAALFAVAMGVWYWAVFIRVDPYTALRREEVQRMVKRLTQSEPLVVREPHPSRRFVDTLPPDSGEEFELIERSQVWDLRAWTPVDESRISTPQSPVVMTERMRLKKLQDVDVFRIHARTTGADVFLRCLSHPDGYRVLASDKPVQVAGTVMKSRQIELDVSNVERGGEFTLVESNTFWNAFRNSSEWCGAIVRRPVLKISFLIIFPKDKPLKSHKLQVTPLDSGNLQPYTGDQFIFVADDKSYIFWEIAKPTPGLVYRLDWEW